MAETITANYGWTKPDPGASSNTWGSTLNATTDKIDAQVFVNQAGAVPVGSGALWFAPTPPINWLICDNSLLSTAAPYDKLFAVLGTRFNQSGDAAGTFRLPPLLNVFPFGGSLGAKGGEANHTLTVGEMPSHAHSITDQSHSHTVNQYYHDHSYSQTPHGHGASQDDHTHTIGGTLPGGGYGAQNGPGAVVGTGTTSGASASGVYIQPQYANINFAGVTSAISINGSGSNITGTNANGGGATHNNMPPYLGVNFIIKYQ
jgi:microcystin-dependent protein